MKFNKLFEQDFKIVENKKKVFIAPVVILVIALIAGIVFHFVSGSAFNLGMDFTGGYTISVNLGNKLTDDTYDYYKDYAVNVAEELKDSEGNKYGIKISSVQRQGEADTAGLLLKYKAVGDEEKMETVNEELKDALSQSMFFFKPTIALNDAKNGFTATYDSILLVGDYEYTFTNKLNDAGFDVKTATISDDKKSIAVTFNSAVTDENAAKLEDVMTISDNYGGMVSDGGQTSSTVSSETLKSALLAISISLLCMLIYIVIRFELLSGIAAVLALTHDLVIMLCGMVVFHIEINSTFIAAIITIHGYSINNTIIIFDRVRENLKFYANKRINGKMVKPAYIANKSVKDTVWRSINTTLTTLIMIAMVAIIGVPDIRVFALPIIFGLLAGTYSSVFLAPTIWALLEKAFPGKVKQPKAKRSPAKAKADK